MQLLLEWLGNILITRCYEVCIISPPVDSSHAKPSYDDNLLKKSFPPDNRNALLPMLALRLHLKVSNVLQDRTKGYYGLQPGHKDILRGLIDYFDSNPCPVCFTEGIQQLTHNLVGMPAPAVILSKAYAVLGCDT